MIRANVLTSGHAMAMTLAPYRASMNRGLELPDLGFRNHRFRNISFRFKRQSIYEGKTRFLTTSSDFTTDE